MLVIMQTTILRKEEKKEEKKGTGVYPVLGESFLSFETRIGRSTGNSFFSVDKDLPLATL